MSRICKTCGSLFKATGNEQECPTCKEGFKGWCKGNALKYSLRAGRKDPAKEVQDLAKAGVFLSWITGE